jgi:hypothetical protein
MECSDSNCAYCNNEETVCSGYSYGVVFDKNGQDVEYFEEDVYRIGNQGSIRYTERDETCLVTIGGTECSQCNMHDCSDGYYGVAVSCANVEDGAVFNSCDETFASTGILEAFNDNEFETCYDTLEICQIGRTSIDNRFQCFCDNDPDSADVSFSTCQDSCEYCNGSLEVCGKENYQETFQNAMFTGSKRTIQYTSGRSEVVEYEESNCDPLSGCQDCAFRVDGVACESCSIHTCANGTKAPLVQCSNIDSGLSETVDFCAATKLTNTVLEFFEAGFTDSCVPTPVLACRDASTKYGQHAHKFVCDCVDQADGYVELQCQSTCGDLCNDEETVCVRESFSQDFLDEGGSSYFRKDIKYTHGRQETLTYVEFIDGTCSMKVDGVGCSSCLIDTCQGNPEVQRAPRIDCSDFEGGGILDLCESDIRVETGIFERFSIEEFNECMDRTPTNGVCDTNLPITAMPHQSSGTTLMIPYDGVESCGSVQSFAPGLWYSVVGNGTGVEVSVCEPEADFDVQISVYTGLDCKNLVCLAASDSACKLDWVGEEGKTYYIRVHGTGGQIGNFDLSVRHLNYGSAACKVDKTTFENNPNLETSCRPCEAPDANGYVHLHCSVDCSTCDESGNVCANKTATTKFDNAGHIIMHNQTYQFVSGRDESLTLAKFNCSEPGDCQTCEVTIDDTTCESCEVVDCTLESANPKKGVVATCGRSTINSCETPEFESAGILRPLVDSTYERCFSRAATAACLDYKAFEQDIESGIFCDCDPFDATGNTRLLCRRQSCLRCNLERSICGYDAFGAIFYGEFGRQSDRFRGFQYIQGRNDLVLYHIANDTARSNGTCTMTVNDKRCDSCAISQCDDTGAEQLGEFHGISFDCQNIPDGLFYDGCSMIALPETFEFINSQAFEDCVPVPSPQEACQAILLQTMVSRSSQSEFCNCSLTETGLYELRCTDHAECQFCSDDSETTCADLTNHRVEINHFGLPVAHIESYQWESGRDELLVVRDTDVDCQVMVNGEVCSSCAHTNCSNSNHGLSINCSNVLGTNATFTCGVGHEIFTPISDSARYVCLGDSLAPSTSIPSRLPTTSPSASPSRERTMPPQVDLKVNENMSESDASRRLYSIALFASSTLLIALLL